MQYHPTHPIKTFFFTEPQKKEKLWFSPVQTFPLSVALNGGDIDEDNSQDEEYSEEKDDEMWDDEGIDDSITLVQYQEEARREAFIKKGSHT